MFCTKYNTLLNKFYTLVDETGFLVDRHHHTETGLLADRHHHHETEIIYSIDL